MIPFKLRSCNDYFGYNDSTYQLDLSTRDQVNRGIFESFVYGSTAPRSVMLIQTEDGEIHPLASHRRDLRCNRGTTHTYLSAYLSQLSSRVSKIYFYFIHDEKTEEGKRELSSKFEYSIDANGKIQTVPSHTFSKGLASGVVLPGGNSPIFSYRMPTQTTGVNRANPKLGSFEEISYEQVLFMEPEDALAHLRAFWKLHQEDEPETLLKLVKAHRPAIRKAVSRAFKPGTEGATDPAVVSLLVYCYFDEEKRSLDLTDLCEKKNNVKFLDRMNDTVFSMIVRTLNPLSIRHLYLDPTPLTNLSAVHELTTLVSLDLSQVISEQDAEELFETLPQLIALSDSTNQVTYVKVVDNRQKTSYSIELTSTTEGIG